MKQAKMSLEFLHIGLRSTVVGAAYSQNLFEHQQRQQEKQVKAFAKTISQFPLKDSIATSSEWVGTTNMNMRKPNFVIIHHTAQNSCEQTLQTFTTPSSQVSAHYVICKNGTIHHMLNDYLRAWQAGISRWGNVPDVNSVSIGIEIDNNGFEPFTDQQINSLLIYLVLLKKNTPSPLQILSGI